MTFTATSTDTYFISAEELFDTGIGTYTLKAGVAGIVVPKAPTSTMSCTAPAAMTQSLAGRNRHLRGRPAAQPVPVAGGRRVGWSGRPDTLQSIEQVRFGAHIGAGTTRTSPWTG